MPKTNKFKIIEMPNKPVSQQELLFGFSNSTFQAYYGHGDGDSNWTHASKNGTVPPLDYSIELWEKFEDDLDLMVQTGVNSYRFSFEWSQIEPEQGQFNQIAIARYRQMINACVNRGIKPMMTLYHFNEPLWFTKLGGFEKEINIQHFVNFCKTIFNCFHDKVELWCSINEPGIQAFSGHLIGRFPPHQRSLRKALNVLTNLLKAHTAVYKTLKQMRGGQEIQIGIVHNPLKFIPRYSWEPISVLLSKFFTKITNNLIIEFLKTGHLKYGIPWFGPKAYYDPSAMDSYDFLGLNFYAHPVIGFNKVNFFGPTSFPHQEMGEMYLPLDSENFGHAIDEFASLGKPVYVTETGIADSKDKLREKFLKEYLEVFQKKRQAGVDLRGIYYWTFADNYEWNEGYEKKFGLHDRHRNKRSSAIIFEEFMWEHKQSNLSLLEEKTGDD